nr:MAG TPA: hypothetical protein [Caudoviricetes sp.]
MIFSLFRCILHFCATPKGRTSHGLNLPLFTISASA